MKKLLFIIVTGIVLLSSLFTSSVFHAKAATSTVDLLSINDFHGRIEAAGKDPGAAKLISYIKEFKGNNPNTAVLGAGDLFQGSPISNLTKGDATAEVLKESGMQYSALGNHEFDWEVASTALPRWETLSGIKFLAANIYDVNTGERATFAQPTTMISIGGKKIGVIGISTPETAYKTNLANIAGLEFRDPVNDINTLATQLRADGANAVVVLSHLGATQSGATVSGEAASVASQISGVDALITGHTHMNVNGIVNNIPIVQAESYGRAIANIKLTFDDTTNTVTKVTSSVQKFVPTMPSTVPTPTPILISDMQIDQTSANIVAARRATLSSLLDEHLADLPSDLNHTRMEGSSPLGQYFSYLAGNELVELGYLEKQPIVIMNGGGYRDSIAAGEITVGTMYNITPFDNYLVTMDLTYDQLKSNLENGIMNTNVGWVTTSGITVYYDSSKPAGERITEMYYTPVDATGNQTALAIPIVAGDVYPVVINDFMFTGGDQYNFSGAQNIKTFDGNMMRDSISNQLKKIGTVNYTHYPRTLAIDTQANTAPDAASVESVTINTTKQTLTTVLSSQDQSKVVKDTKANTTSLKSQIESLIETLSTQKETSSGDYVETKFSGKAYDEMMNIINDKPNAVGTFELVVTAVDGKTGGETTSVIPVTFEASLAVTAKETVFKVCPDTVIDYKKVAEDLLLVVSDSEYTISISSDEIFTDIDGTKAVAVKNGNITYTVTDEHGQSADVTIQVEVTDEVCPKNENTNDEIATTNTNNDQILPNTGK